MCGIMLLVRVVLNIIVSPRGPMCFRCLMFSFSGPCESFLLPLWPDLW